MAKKTKKLKDLNSKREVKGGAAPVSGASKTSIKLTKIQNKKGFEPLSM